MPIIHHNKMLNNPTFVPAGFCTLSFSYSSKNCIVLSDNSLLFGKILDTQCDVVYSTIPQKYVYGHFRTKYVQISAKMWASKT